MKKFNITVNGNAYEVEIEEVKAAAAPAPKAAPAPAAAPAPKAAPAAAAPAAAGDNTVSAPMPGKIVKLVASVGQAVNAGDVLLILEAMKMQNEITAPVAGTVKSFAVNAGDSVKPGQAMVVIG
ncbi:biotin/lipoyl-containing protein [uncultured Megamonas sp.]|uniref:biotin/lipoyl-containing protein n=1 Tax=uncultured Megamonas sp. TaxID=286140 RepID=UPI0025F334D8|nr:biotin/lipoyl-containing protein [uncultured Megamonas sp.]